MGRTDDTIICRVREHRLAAGLSQAQLADRIGVKRQAVYDIESGRYLPNTAVALRLAKVLGRRVEDLFSDSSPEEVKPLVMAGGGSHSGRVSLAKVRGRLVGHPLEGVFSLRHEFRAADGILDPGGNRVRLLNPSPNMENTVFLMGCDPAFSILAAHVARKDPKAMMVCRFASSHSALNALAAGQTHIAGSHLHVTAGKDMNVDTARKKMLKTGGMLIGFSLIEEGFIVAPGNPMGIRSAADLAAPGIRMVNREPGAALRVLLDDELAKQRIPPSAVQGYDHEVATHNQGAQMVACRAADAALGLRPIACAFGLDFVPIQEVRCDLVIPADLADLPAIRILLDILQTRALREEISLLNGYSAVQTGNVIDRFDRSP